MTKIKFLNQISLDKLNDLIEQKILEVIGDPDYGLELRPDFKKEIIRRLYKKTKK